MNIILKSMRINININTIYQWTVKVFSRILYTVYCVRTAQYYDSHCGWWWPGSIFGWLAAESTRGACPGPPPPPPPHPRAASPPAAAGGGSTSGHQSDICWCCQRTFAKFHSGSFTIKNLSKHYDGQAFKHGKERGRREIQVCKDLC